MSDRARVSDQSVDVVVVGAGVAGLAAAFTASCAGLRVMVIDAASEEWGGASRISVGGTLAVGSDLQRQAGLYDSVELALADWQDAAGKTFDAAWARRYLEGSAAEVLEWCERTLGTRWSELRQHEYNSVARWHLPAGGGAAVVEALAQRVSANGGEIRVGHTAEELITRDGAVIAALVAGPDGHVKVEAQATVIATGGFVNNPEMLCEHVPALRGAEAFLCGGSSTALGLGHKLLERAGGVLVNMDELWVYPVGLANPWDPRGRRGLVVRGVDAEIWCNAEGLRFHDETRRGGASGTPALLAQPGRAPGASLTRGRQKESCCSTIPRSDRVPKPTLSASRCSGRSRRTAPARNRSRVSRMRSISRETR